MTFEWGAAKRTRNETQRGFDFEFATLVFSGPHGEVDDTRRDYGACRVIALGVAGGIPLTIVYTESNRCFIGSAKTSAGPRNFELTRRR